MSYIEIDDSEIAIDAPITNNLITKLRDNLDAIKNGDSSAPQTTTHGKTSIINRDVLKRSTPTAGTYIIWHSQSSADGDDSSVLSCYVDTAGEYKIEVNARHGQTENTGDQLPLNHTGTVSLRVTDHSDDTTTVLQTDTINRFEAANYSIDRNFATADQTIFLKVEANGDRMRMVFSLSIGVADSDTMYGIDVRGNLT